MPGRAGSPILHSLLAAGRVVAHVWILEEILSNVVERACSSSALPSLLSVGLDGLSIAELRAFEQRLNELRAADSPPTFLGHRQQLERHREALGS